MGIAEIAAWEWDIRTGRMTWSTDPEALFGFPAGSFGDDQRITRVLHPDDKQRVEQTISNALRSCSSYECEYRVSRPDGAAAWITERGHALCGEDGDAERVVGVSRDVSAQRRAEQAREQALLNERRARDEAERQSRIKDEFLATLSHELRTPMNAILGWLSMLAKGEGVRDPEHAIGAIQRNAQVQAKLIEDLLEMNKLASGTIRLDLGTLDLEATLNAAIESLRPTADTKGVHLSTRVNSPLPSIQADARRVQQILWNLVQNGVKFTRPGGSVHVHVDTCGESVQIQVGDTGEGISPDFLPFVFDRFRQAEPSSARGSAGLGLGLSIVKHLVELHGGSISASSPGVNRGSTFTIVLPVLSVSRMGDVRAAVTA
jgi:PAS domain S-box-containing protein